MALSPEQQVILVEITQETLDRIKSVTLTDEQVLWVSDDIDLWQEERNNVDVELDGEVKYRVSPLLSDIRKRVRKQLGFSLYSDEPFGGSSQAIPVISVF
jgi:hypothetical protein